MSTGAEQLTAPVCTEPHFLRRASLYVLRALGAVITLLVSQSAICAEIEKLSVVKSGTGFIAEVQFVIVAPYETVFDAFTDFERIAEFSPTVVASREETLPNGNTRVSTTLRDCVALFCRSVTLVEDVRFSNGNLIVAELVPESSDFRHGHSEWRFRDLGDRTRVHYSSEMTPDFWIPPVVGARALRGTLRRQIEATADHLENRRASQPIHNSTIGAKPP